MSCDCRDWASVDHVHRVLTGHHERCQHSPAPLPEALELIAELTRAVELWGAEEDGVHPAAWEAYRKGKALQGVFVSAFGPDECVCGAWDDARRTTNQIRRAVDAACTCGGAGPDDGCPACNVWHILYPANAAPHGRDERNVQ